MPAPEKIAKISAYDGIHCPVCGSDDISTEGIGDFTGSDTFVQTVGCHACGSYWHEAYNREPAAYDVWKATL